MCSRTTRQEQPPSVWFCFPSSPITTTTISGRRETSRDCLYSRFSLLLSPVPSRSRCCSPPSSPLLSCLSCPCAARHKTFLRASVGVLTVPGFPFSSRPSSSTAVCLVLRPGHDNDNWPFPPIRGQPSLSNPRRIEPQSLLDCDTLQTPHPAVFIAAKVAGDSGP